MFKKFGIAALFIAVAWLLFLYQEPLLHWIEQGDTRLIPVTMGIAVLMALVPVVPYPLVGGVIGAAYGPLIGSSISWFGSTAASLLMFLLIRYLLQDYGARLLHSQKRGRLDRLTSLFERNAFFTILICRLIPLVPSVPVNAYSALSRVSFTVFAIASALGKIPAMVLFAVAGDQALSEPRNLLITLGAYALFLLATWLFYNWWNKQKLPRQSQSR